MNDHQADKSINRSVEACQEGVVELKNHKEVLIPDGLRQELLSYIKGQGLTMGPVFISGRGNPLDRSNITHMVNRRGKQAGLDPAKCNPRALHKLHRRVQEETNKKVIYMQIDDVLSEEYDGVKSAV